MRIIPGRFGYSLETPESESGYRSIASYFPSQEEETGWWLGTVSLSRQVLVVIERDIPAPETAGRTRYNNRGLPGRG